MASKGKRRAVPDDSEVIDLTASSPPPFKTTKYNNGSVHSSQLIGSSQHTASYLPSSSSQRLPNSSQPITIHDDADEYLVEDGIDVNSSQTFDTNLTLYGTLNTKIVGIRYYNGYVSAREMVMIKREPTNQYDSNAIQVLNGHGDQIGHIPRGIAAKLAPFMDQKRLMIEGETLGEKAVFDCPLAVRMYGPIDSVVRNDLKSDMKAVKLPTDGLKEIEKADKEREKQKQNRLKQLKKAMKGGAIASMGGNGDFANMSNSQFAGSSAAATEINIDEIIQQAERFNPRSFDEMAEKFGSGEEILKGMPQAKQPESIQSQLLPFQLQGLQWMIEKENPKLPGLVSEDSVQLWKRSRGTMFTNMATNFTLQNAPPNLASGGILADDMGLGKTIQVISLIMADQKLNVKNNDVAGATLIVSPLSVMSNWTQQIQKHVREDHPVRIMVYHGAKKGPLNTTTVKDFDVVITTYDTVRTEHFKNKGNTTLGLNSIIWRRIVLDEGHNIRNPAAKTATASYALQAQSRWILTGTPIVNTLKDLYSLVRFLGLSGGVDKWELFNNSIIRPLNQGYERGSQLLQALMNSICLRRKKEMKFIDLKLPELSEYIHRIDFAPHEKEMYDALNAQATGSLEDYQKKRNQAGGDSSKAYRNLLEILLRMRQLCNHSSLVGEERLKLLEGLEGQILDLTPENKAALEAMLQLSIDSQEDCPICLDSMTDPVITLCTHIFCFACIEKVIEGQHKCPMCRAQLEETTKLLRPVQEATQVTKFEVTETSTKVEALLSILQASKKGSKTIVFSQWTSFLNVVELQLMKHGIKYVRIDGTMPAHARDKSITDLENNSSVTVLLASLGVCSVGLNLVAANQVILADSWWAPAIEDQAVDRVHRLGQKRETTVFRLVMSGSIEERVLNIQSSKRKLMMLAFSEKQAKRGNEKGARLDDIQALLKG